MARAARVVEAGMNYHVLNRGNGRMRLFHKAGDYAAFEDVLAEGVKRYPVEVLTYCLMPNHWHLVLRPGEARALGRFMGWVGVTHVRRHHEHYQTRGGGHLYQGRFKSFPIQDDRHFLTVCRYVEGNAVRAGLVGRAEEWQWGALWRRSRGARELAGGAWPVDRPRGWAGVVNDGVGEEELASLRTCVGRGRPFGEAGWVEQTAGRLGLGFTLRGVGRPRKAGNE